MKVRLFASVSIAFALYSCSSTPEARQPEQTVNDEQVVRPDKSPVLKQWLAFYQIKGSPETEKVFKLETVEQTEFMPGSVPGSFDKTFNPVYNPFLIYAPDKQKYVDIDSYQWFIDNEGERSFSPDQEINLVDLKHKKVARIAFRGPSQWVEDAFWKNDSTVCLLENDDSGKLRITEIDLVNGTTRSFVLKGTVKQKELYSEKRFELRSGDISGY